MLYEPKSRARVIDGLDRQVHPDVPLPGYLNSPVEFVHEDVGNREGMGRAYGVPLMALRHLNLYGSRQALSNPYSGLAKILASDFTRGKASLICEDGLQTRDSIHESGVSQATLLSLQAERANGEIFNVATGRPTAIFEMARAVARRLDRDIATESSCQYCAGNLRYFRSDTTKILCTRLGFEPWLAFSARLEDLPLRRRNPRSAQARR